MKKAVLITGSEGDIGRALIKQFSEEGYRTLGVGLFETHGPQEDELQLDLRTLTSEADIADFRERLTQMLGKDDLVGLINNAATQILGSFEELSLEQFTTSLQVNCTAAFAVSKAAIFALKACKGTILNMGSIHARLTKSNFIAYATSKAALEGLTRAMAVELGAVVKTCALSPAAIATDMLKAGFLDNDEALEQLKRRHPTKTVGRPEEIAKVAALLIGCGVPFSNGAVWSLDGGIGSVLHDPA